MFPANFLSLLLNPIQPSGDLATSVHVWHAFVYGKAQPPVHAHLVMQTYITAPDDACNCSFGCTSADMFWFLLAWNERSRLCQVVRLEDYVLLAGVLPILLTALDKTRQTACSAMHVIRRLLLNAVAQHKVSCTELLICAKYCFKCCCSIHLLTQFSLRRKRRSSVY